MRQTLACVDDSLKKLVIGDKIKPLGVQRVGPKSGQLGVTMLVHFIVQFGTRKC